jgi:putative ABC transport system permease protein
VTGIFLGKILTQMYNKIFSIPVMSSNYYWDTILIGMGLSIIFCLFSAYNALKRILKIQASEAMRPESPKTGRRIFLEKIPFIWSKFPFGWKMSIRNIFRSRQRAFATALGTAIP